MIKPDRTAHAKNEFSLDTVHAEPTTPEQDAVVRALVGTQHDAETLLEMLGL